MLVAHDTLIMIVDGARLAMFRNKGNMHSPPLELLVQEQRIMPSIAELGNDQPGRAFQSTWHRRGAYDAVDLHQLIQDSFIQEMAKLLTSLLRDDEAHTILIVPPHALGLMRMALPADVRERLIAEIDKDCAGRTATEVGQLLNGYEL